MKAVISYRYNGEIISNLEILLSMVCNTLKTISIEPYCIFFERYKVIGCDNIPSEMLKIAFSKIDSTDFLFVIQASEIRSEGMLMEIGYAFAKGKKVIIATKEGIQNTYLPSMANLSLTYKDVDDLLQKIKKIDFTTVILRNYSSKI